MAAPELEVCDQAVRDRVTGELGTTFLLEASAGTGKTRVLVDRYVTCVLDPERGTGDVGSVAAITFTEKAAGELRQRVRERFEKLAATTPEGSAEHERIVRALDALDDAPISTIHSFAGRLLREFPVEAGVDPGFEQLDQLGSDLGRSVLWEEWLTELAAGATQDADSERARGWLTRLLGAGVRLAAVRELAIGRKGVFDERYDLDMAFAPPPPPDLVTGLGELRTACDRLRDHCSDACSDQSDKGFAGASDLIAAVDACAALAGDGSADLDQVAAALHQIPLKMGKTGPGGVRTNWDAGRGGKEELLVRYRHLGDGIGALRSAYAEHITGYAVAVAQAFARWAGAAQLRLGRLDFTDLLGALRDLLVRDVAARRELQRRFRYLLVDEFQDTDPLQAESVFLLCEREPLARDWRQVVLEPGKLFVVGDPKQSIYRFRRADIALYDEVKAYIKAQPQGKGEAMEITQNFRTTPALAGWINNVFAGVFDDEAEVGRQPNYCWAEPYRPPAPGPRVAVLLGRAYDHQAGETDAMRRDEARALAALLHEMHGDAAGQWTVCDRSSSDADGEVERAPRWGDVAVLMRATTGLETYEHALREAGVPYRVEGGKTYFERREVADALLCLRAVEDPSDGPAVYGALHSSLFGFTDDDLFLFWAAGGRFDLFADGSGEGQAGGRRQPAGHEAVTGALESLRRLHACRATHETHELVEDLLRVTHSEELQAATGDGAAQALANLEKLVERAKAFSAAGGGGVGAFLSWADEAGDAAGEQESQVDDESDVVHLLTIHKAKGLEYPIVVLAGGASGGGRYGGGEPIVDRRRRRVSVKVRADLPGASHDLVPRSYEELAERAKAMNLSEGRRLLYVAATRARDRLVVSCFGRLTTKGDEPASVLLGPLAHQLPVPGSVSESGDYDGLLVLLPGEPPVLSGRGERFDVAALRAAREVWKGERAELLARAGQPMRATSPSALEQVDEVVLRGGPGAPPGRAEALALGSAVHRVMELCALDDEASLGPLAAAAAAELGRPDLEGRTAVLADACWRAAVVRAAARSPEVFREVPVGMLVRGTIVSGAIDLLYRDGDEWVVVDYKTDRDVDAEVLRERYSPQGAAYALAVEAATGAVVREVAFVAAAARVQIVVPIDDEVRRAARGSIATERARFLVAQDESQS